MSQFWVPGPTQVFVGLGASQAWEFLGFSEQGVQVDIDPHWEPVSADYAGAMEADTQFLGESWRCSGTLSRYNEQVLQSCVARIPNTTPGEGGANSLGSLMITEGLSYPLLLYFPYNVKTQYTNMVKCYYVLNAYFSDPYSALHGIRAKKPTFGFRAIPTFGNAPYNTYNLYSTTPPATIPTPD